MRVESLQQDGMQLMANTFEAQAELASDKLASTGNALQLGQVHLQLLAGCRWDSLQCLNVQG